MLHACKTYIRVNVCKEGECLFWGSCCRLRAEQLVSFADSLLKVLQDQTIIRTMCTDEQGPHRRLHRDPPTTWNYRSGLQTVPGGRAPLLLPPWPLTWSVWLTPGEETWCRVTLCPNALKTLFVVFSVEHQGIGENLLRLFLMWRCVTVSGSSDLQPACHIMASLGFLTISFSDQIFWLAQLR